MRRSRPTLRSAEARSSCAGNGVRETFGKVKSVTVEGVAFQSQPFLCCPEERLPFFSFLFCRAFSKYSFLQQAAYFHEFETSNRKVGKFADFRDANVTL
ncbi:hypothetical protein CDAR_493851 [Caerostris darwini]|uniref:Uncharacterized protein n=1 Tax=Caerostris darwini TaxID=1538125 RepID=A0AAV4VTV6_9ARAC|nr:hypothetical protein CDAR_493851 [Caerostris darwini]